MRILLMLAAALVLGGCASDGYRYHDDGYYTGEAPRRHVTVSIGYGTGCRPGVAPWSYPGAYGCGYGFGSWYGPHYGYVPGYGGYWHDPYWSQRWYLPPRTPEAPRAGQRARHLAEVPSLDGDFPRYDELAPQRRRDVGGGDRAWRESRQWRQPPSEYGTSRAGYGVSSGLSGASRGHEGNFGSRSSGLGGTSMGSGRGGSAGSAARAMVRESREEE